LQIIFLASLAPMALLAAAFGLGTFTVLRQVHADLDQVASAVAQSHAERAVIASFAGRATVRWLSGLGLFWVVGSATLVIQVLAYRRFSRRITRAAARAQRILTGEEEVDVRDLPIRDPLDRLEQKLEELGGEIRERRRRLESETRHQQLGAQIQQALAMSESEAEVLAVTERVLERGVATARGSLLLADSSRAHMHTIISPSDPCGVCPVESPSRCPAVRAGRTVIYPSSSDLDACPRLHGRPGGPCSAACVPVTIMGHAVGVLHVVGEDGAPPVSELLPLEVLTRHLGVRIGMIRTLETAQLQAERDPLTGLLNRRTLTARVTEIMAAGRTFSFAMLDLDHFKRLNDTAGHEVGALRGPEPGEVELHRVEGLRAHHGVAAEGRHQQPPQVVAAQHLDAAQRRRHQPHVRDALASVDVQLAAAVDSSVEGDSTSQHQSGARVAAASSMKPAGTRSRRHPARSGTTMSGRGPRCSSGSMRMIHPARVTLARVVEAASFPTRRVAPGRVAAAAAA
jgi:hypothetical protein